MYVRDDTLYFLEESCLNCTVSTMHESCLDSPEAKFDDIARSVPTKKKTDDGNQDEDNQAGNIVGGEEDERNTNNESDNESDADKCADECLNIGDVVLDKHGIVWYPAVAAVLDDVPKNIRQYLGCNLEGERIVKWWGEASFSALAKYNVEPLAQNLVDEFQANRSKLISELYHQPVVASIMEE